MHNAVLVQIANGLQNLLNDTTGVLLRVDAPVQYAVKELAARHTGWKHGQSRQDASFTWTFASRARREENSQLHDEIVVGPSLIEILHPHNVVVFDSGGSDDRFLTRMSELWCRGRGGAGCHCNAYFLNTLISFSRLRSVFCFFFTHFMANIFPVFFSFTMYTSEKAPLWGWTQKDTHMWIQAEQRHTAFTGCLWLWLWNDSVSEKKTSGCLTTHLLIIIICVTWKKSGQLCFCLFFLSCGGNRLVCTCTWAFGFK